MDAQRFDAFARSLGAPRTRRQLVRSLVAIVTGGALAQRGERRALADCPPGLYECSGVGCVDLETDPNHCGYCFNACAPGQSCCGKTLVSPFGLCVDLLNDPAHCGACGYACGPGMVCTGGSCACPPGLYDCFGVCVDFGGDPFNCGGCGVVCPSGICQNGVCQTPFVCPGGQTDCGGVCVDLQTDPQNCGACGEDCGAGMWCEAGTCVTCLLPTTACDHQCVDLQSDPDNCGACGNVCPPDHSCCFGACIFDLNNNHWNWGTCGNDCSTYGFVAPTCCNGTCVDLTTDTYNCGECGNACVGEAKPGQSSIGQCVNGYCQIVCEPGFYDCGQGCISLQTDLDNCGACGLACAPNQTCQNGVCNNCLPGLSPCPGACWDFQNDPNHCGGCDIVCAPGETCTGGKCTGAAPAPTIGPAPTSDKWSLWAGETRLRGAHLYQRRLDRDRDDPGALGDGPLGPIYRQADLDRLAALGANYVDISHPAVYGEDAPFELDEDIQDNLDRLLDMASQANLYAVISFRTGPGRPERALGTSLVCRAGGCLAGAAPEAGGFGDCPEGLTRCDGECVDTGSDPDNCGGCGRVCPSGGDCGEQCACLEGVCVPSEEAEPAGALWTDEAAQDAWVELWRTTARRYRNNPIVVGYHLLAIPDAPEATTWQTLAERLTAAVREVDPDTPILVSPPGATLDGLTGFAPPDDARVCVRVDLFGPERYLLQPADAPDPLGYPDRFEPARDGEDGRFDRTWLDARFARLRDFGDARDVPVAVGAVGVPRWQPGAADFLADALASCDEAGLNHALWLWYPAAWPATADDAFDVMRGPDPANHAAVENELLQVVVEHWGRNEDRPAGS